MALAVNEDEERLQRVSVWLAGLYGDTPVPPFEVNSETLSYLDALRRKSTLGAEAHVAATAVYRSMAREYRAHENRTQSLLETAGLPPSALSKVGHSNISVISKTGVLLGVKRPSPSCLCMALSELSTKEHEVAMRKAKQRHSAEKLRARTAEATLQLNELEKFAKEREATAAETDATRAEQMASVDYLTKKAAEYAVTIEKLERCLEDVGMKPELTHDALLRESAVIEETRSELSPQQALLQGYKDLPPDMSLAKLKVLQARKELEDLEAQMAALIRNIHMR